MNTQVKCPHCGMVREPVRKRDELNCAECGKKITDLTPDDLGNGFGYACPRCGSGEHVRVAATVWADLRPDGTDHDGDTEWEDSSAAMCGSCDWSGMVSDLVTIENFTEE